MLYIMTLKEAEMLTEKDKNVLKELTAKDRMIFLNREGENISIPLFMFLNSLKCRTEFAMTYKETEENKDYILFLQAVILSKCEEAVFYSHNTLELPKECSLQVVSSLASKSAKAAPRKKRKAEEKTEEVILKIAEIKEEKETEEEVCEGGLFEKLTAIPELSEEKEYVRLNLDRIKDCLRKSTDANIGFPFNLQLMFGKERGERLAKVLMPEFESLKGSV